MEKRKNRGAPQAVAVDEGGHARALPDALAPAALVEIEAVQGVPPPDAEAAEVAPVAVA